MNCSKGALCSRLTSKLRLTSVNKFLRSANGAICPSSGNELAYPVEIICVIVGLGGSGTTSGIVTVSYSLMRLSVF